LWEDHDDPRDFQAALDLQIRRHGENSHRLHRAIVVAGGLTDRTTLAAWRRGLKVPQTPASLKVLDIIEHRYQLEAGYREFIDFIVAGRDAAARIEPGSFEEYVYGGVPEEDHPSDHCPIAVRFRS